MNMISCATYLHRHMTKLIQDTRKIGMQTWAHGWGNHRLTPLGAEHGMNQNLGQ